MQPIKIITEVCQSQRIDMELIKLKTRKRHIVYARQLCHWALRQYTKLSLSKIGEMVGGKDHATVLHSCKVIDTDAINNKDVRRDVEEVQRRLRGRVIYVSGPISGQNYASVLIRFEGVRAMLQKQGYTVIIPMDVVPKKGIRSWNQCMFYCRKALFDMSEDKDRSIYMMKGWKRSRGAIDELRTAKGLGFNVVYE